MLKQMIRTQSAVKNWCAIEDHFHKHKNRSDICAEKQWSGIYPSHLCWTLPKHFDKVLQIQGKNSRCHLSQAYLSCFFGRSVSSVSFPRFLASLLRFCHCLCQGHVPPPLFVFPPFSTCVFPFIQRLRLIAYYAPFHVQTPHLLSFY